MSMQLFAHVEAWPIAGDFVIARGARSQADVVVVEARSGGARGRGECVPYARYGEDAETVCAAVEAAKALVAAAPGPAQAREHLLLTMKAGAARNAIDCALWDLEAKLAGTPAWRLAGLPEPAPVTTAFTISLGSPDSMAAAANRAAQRPLLKVKLGGGDDPARLRAVRAAAPEARLIADANEAWRPADWTRNLEACLEAGVEMIEQPFPAALDAALAHLPRPTPVCADESAHDAASLAEIADRYDAVNVKLDKAGGLTAAIDVVRAARLAGLRVMVGCMVGTSLGVAPALLLAGLADVVDLDGPLMLSRDRTPGLRYAGSIVSPPCPDLWG